jgi:hypothetical protein
MKWYHYLSVFFAGIFLANAVPHFIHGVSGDAFPTPFANPPAKGLSSPTLNVLWACFNLLIGYILFRASKITFNNKWAIFILFLGIVTISITLSFVFIEKAKL